MLKHISIIPQNGHGFEKRCERLYVNPEFIESFYPIKNRLWVICMASGESILITDSDFVKLNLNG